MEARRRTWFDDRGLVVRTPDSQRALPFYAGAMHYWRVEPARWAACLAQLHAQGLRIVETHVPWRVHEPAAGAFDWAGPRDLRRFVELADAAGLAVVLRPGPSVNAELACFGLPDDVVGDPAMQARTARGTPVWLPSPTRAWPVPSYASAAFLARVRAWYAAVGAIAGPLLAPEGPIVAIGVDSEAQLFFRLGAYDCDYHPDAIAWWREEFDGDPPRAWSAADAAGCAAWVKFKDRYAARALGAFAAALDDAGFAGIARFHNAPGVHADWSGARQIQAAIGGPVGIDSYAPRGAFRALRRRAFSFAADAAPIPIAFEAGIGSVPWFPPLDAGADPQRERDHLLTLLAAGMRGFNLYMAVERDRHFGAAIDATGALAPHAAWIEPLVAALDEVGWPALRRRAVIALVATRADARFGLATSVIDPIPPALVEALGMGPGGAAELGEYAGAIAARRWHDALASALELAQVPYAIVDESTSEDELAGYAAIVVPTIERVDRALWRRLCAIAGRRAAIVVIGPGTPVRDELDQPLDEPAARRAGRLKPGSLDDLPGLAADLSSLAGALPDAWQIERPDDVRAFAYADADGDARVVFVASDADRAVQAVLIAGDGALQLRDALTGERALVFGGTATIPLPPRGIRMLVVEY